MIDRAIAAVLQRAVRAGRLEIHGPEGDLTLEGSEPGPSASVTVRRPGLLRAVASGGSNALTEAYLDGALETDDLAAFFTFAAANQHDWAQRHPRLYRWGRSLAAMLPNGHAEVAVDTMAEHYNLGNDFYARWLDPSMTYSSARFTDPNSTLAEAQRAKYEAMVRVAGLQPGHRVLEIGSGWGAFAMYAAELGCHVTTLTIAEEQARHVHDLASARGLTGSIDVRLQDFLDESGTYDRVVSIEMIESIDERRWPEYFATIEAVLEPGGRAGIQAIIIDDDAYAAYRSNEDFIRRYIFPGGMLPSMDVLRRLATAADLSWDHAETFGHDYAKTLALWHQQFDEAWPIDGFDERFRRMWKAYLAYCEAGFTVGRIDVAQIGLSARD